MKLEILNVREIGEVTETKIKKNFLGDEVSQTKGERLFLVNTKFSDPNHGFLINAAGYVLTCTTDFTMKPEEVRRLAIQAKEKIAQDNLNTLELKIDISNKDAKPIKVIVGLCGEFTSELFVHSCSQLDEDTPENRKRIEKHQATHGGCDTLLLEGTLSVQNGRLVLNATE